MSFTSEEKGEQRKLVWSAQMALLEQRQDRNSLILRRKEIIQCWKLCFYSCVSRLLFVLNLNGTETWSVQVKMIYECFVRAEAIGTDNRRQLSRKQAGIMYMTGAFQRLGNLHFFGFISLSLTVGVIHSLNVLHFSEWYGLLTMSW